jgi:hypothetical protein
MAMPLVYSRITGKKVIITFPVHIIQEYPFSTVQDYWQRMIIMRTVLFLQVKVVLRFLTDLKCV